MDVWGVWLGIGIAVSTGWVLALVITRRIAREEIGGLRGGRAAGLSGAA